MRSLRYSLPFFLFQFVLMVVSYSSVSAQSGWARKEDSLYEAKERKEITDDEWWRAIKEDAGHISRPSSLWALNKPKKITNSLVKNLGSDNIKGVSLYIANGGKPKGETEDVIVYLVNSSNRPIHVPRKDATIDKNHIKEYVLISDKWVELLEKSPIMGCGNGYFKSVLEPGYCLDLETFTMNYEGGSVSLKYKIVIEIEGKSIESNVVDITWFEAQYKRVIDEGG